MTPPSASYADLLVRKQLGVETLSSTIYPDAIRPFEFETALTV